MIRSTPPRLRFVRSHPAQVVGALFVLVGLVALPETVHGVGRAVPWLLGGLVILLARTGVDVGDDAVRRWWGLPFPLWGKGHARGSFDTVALIHDAGDDDGGRFGTWTITLDGLRPVDIAEVASEAEALATGRALARELQLRMVVVSGTDATVREIPDVHVGLRDRLRRDGLEWHGTAGWTTDDGVPRFELVPDAIVAPRRRLLAVLGLAAAALGLAGWGGAGRDAIAVVLLLVDAALAASLASDAVGRADLLALHEGVLVVRSRRHGRWTEVVLPVDELDVVEVRERPDLLGAGADLVVRGRGPERSLGAGVPADDLDGVRTALHAAIATAEPRDERSPRRSRRSR